MQVGLTVGQILYLDVLERLAHRLDAVEERRDHDRGPELRRHAVLAQVELGERTWGKERGDELIHPDHRDVARRDQGQEQGQPGGAPLRARQPERRREENHGAGENATHEDEVGMPEYRSV